MFDYDSFPQTELFIYWDMEIVKIELGWLFFCGEFREKGKNLGNLI